MSQPAALSLPPSEGYHQGHPPLTITINSAADFAAFYETFQRLTTGNTQASEDNVYATSPVRSMSTNHLSPSNDMNEKTHANIHSVMRKLNLLQTPKENAIGAALHEGDARGNIPPRTACTPASTSGNPFDEPHGTNSDPMTHQKEEENFLGVPQTSDGS